MVRANRALVVHCVAVIALTLTAACRSSTPGGPGVPGDSRDALEGIDLCNLVTAEEVEEATGATLEEVRKEPDNCTWNLEELQFINLRIESRSDPDLQGARAAWPEGEDVPNLGDRAYWAPEVEVLYVVKSGVTVAVQLGLTDVSTSEARDVAEELVRTALDELEG